MTGDEPTTGTESTDQEAASLIKIIGLGVSILGVMFVLPIVVGAFIIDLPDCGAGPMAEIEYEPNETLNQGDTETHIGTVAHNGGDPLEPKNIQIVFEVHHGDDTATANLTDENGFKDAVGGAGIATVDASDIQTNDELIVGEKAEIEFIAGGFGEDVDSYEITIAYEERSEPVFVETETTV